LVINVSFGAKVRHNRAFLPFLRRPQPGLARMRQFSVAANFHLQRAL
jgi:hypothetical protein